MRLLALVLAAAGFCSASCCRWPGWAGPCSIWRRCASSSRASSPPGPHSGAADCWCWRASPPRSPCWCSRASSNGVRNGRGIAWSVPQPENVEFAEAGIAVTAMDESTVLTGRDLATGDRRWRLSLGEPSQPTGQLNLQRVGRTLLVTARDGVLRAVDLDTGKVRWKTPRSEILIPAIANPEVVAMTRCSDSDDCTVEARSIEDGSGRWAAPVVLDGAFLGAPGGGEQLNERAKLWPASVVIVRVPPEGARYEVRALATGRVVARGSAERDLLGVTGNLFLRATEEGALSATDVASGREVWTRRRTSSSAVRAESVRSDWLGMPDGGLVLTQPGLAAGHLRRAARCVCSTRAPAR